jgi:hypothetical protein
MSVRFHCQVLEAPTHEWMPRGGQSHRELLPWADPYIALLMQRLEERFDLESTDDAGSEPANLTRQGDCLWTTAREDSPNSRLPAVYGGWPLLDDTQETCDDTF